MNKLRHFKLVDHEEYTSAAPYMNNHFLLDKYAVNGVFTGTLLGDLKNERGDVLISLEEFQYFEEIFPNQELDKTAELSENLSLIKELKAERDCRASELTYAMEEIDRLKNQNDRLQKLFWEYCYCEWLQSNIQEIMGVEK